MGYASACIHQQRLASSRFAALYEISKRRRDERYARGLLRSGASKVRFEMFLFRAESKGHSIMDEGPSLFQPLFIRAVKVESFA